MAEVTSDRESNVFERVGASIPPPFALTQALIPEPGWPLFRAADFEPVLMVADVTINGRRDQSNCASRYPGRKLPASAESALARCHAVSGGGSGIFRL